MGMYARWRQRVKVNFRTKIKVIGKVYNISRNQTQAKAKIKCIGKVCKGQG